ncbi:type 2 isopentenyl-diphosphate Delta-isomerase [Microbacterium sp. No. 7]|uniref:type 2 isopentenyl-diphosphate Delta-isomerase n=1 Tax=Microbacterium sp. No. 7 TaxID=1714373 RepID=UPI0006ECF598|nr:type 2 isopentenyl-diphosphate Delta-isomerase [Microbacterium sp. No. 7]ALJ20174.1 isopentenyl pyrophosphate isomerase [Microbacterium sp. No. 7]
MRSPDDASPESAAQDPAGAARSAAVAARKDDHLRLAAAQHEGAPRRNAWDEIEFVHHALDAIDPARCDLSVEFAGLRAAAPFYINAMTGGSERTGEVNRALAIAARETGVPLASGSMGIALDHPETAGTFRVLRTENPDGLLFANIGVERTVDHARRAIDLVAADALQVHVNAVQETVMPEGTTQFSSWIGSLERIVAGVEVPVIVKEVGFGLSRRTLERLASIGVRVADVAGTGGTDFARVENDRRVGGDLAYLAGWGQPAPACLIDAPADGPTLLASGGVRTPLDVVRGLALGARAVGAAGALLKVALDGGADGLVATLAQWQSHTRALLALLGAAAPADLTRTDVIVHGGLAHFANVRGIDVRALAHRSSPLHPENTREEVSP